MTRQIGMKSKRMRADGSHGRNRCVIAHESPGFVNRDGVNTSSNCRSKGSVGPTPGHHLRVEPQQTGGGIFQPNQTTACGDKCQQLSATDMDEGGCGKFGCLGWREHIFAARVRDRADRGRAPGTEACTGKGRAGRGRRRSAHQTRRTQAAQRCEGAIVQNVDVLAREQIHRHRQPEKSCTWVHLRLHSLPHMACPAGVSAWNILHNTHKTSKTICARSSGQ